MTEFNTLNVNLEQFREVIKTTMEKVNVIYFPDDNHFTITLLTGHTTYLLYTQKNVIRTFKNMSAIVSALQLNEESRGLSLLISG